MRSKEQQNEILRAYEYEHDERWRTILRGLGQLATPELERIRVAASDREKARLQLDNGNYDPQKDA